MGEMSPLHYIEAVYFNKKYVFINRVNKSLTDAVF
jgi:hypothetical protein